MLRSMLIVPGSMAVLAVALGGMRGGDIDCPNSGPDVIVSDIFDSMTWGTLNGEIAFTVGTNACNIGDEVLVWIGSTNEHPVISQSLYRIRNNRIEQIGTSWIKHGFGALQNPGCGCTCIPADYSHLGVGCADPYSAGINGVQSYLGPRLEINPHTGEFPFPPSGWGGTGNILDRRLRTELVNIDPALGGGGMYLVEAQYVSAADAAAGNQGNNVSWRECSFAPWQSSWQMVLEGETKPGATAVEAWAAMDPTASAQRVSVPEDGEIVVGTGVTEVSEGWYRYAFAVQNVTCARGIRGLSMGVSPVAAVSSPTFSSIVLHGEKASSSDWVFTEESDFVGWSTEAHAANPQANAIRWGTTYSYTIETNAPPVEGTLEIEIFEPGAVGSISVVGTVPSPGPLDACTLAVGPCPWEIDDQPGVDGGDLAALLGNWGVCGDETFRPLGDTNGDCCVDGADLSQLLGAWGVECSDVGACCFEDGSCLDGLTGAQCALAGGNYRGDRSTCSSVYCPQPGACCLPDGSCVDGIVGSECSELYGLHSVGATCADVDCIGGSDECEGAPPIIEGLHDYSTLLATSGGPIHPECETGNDGGVVGHDIWFSYEPLEDGSLLLSTCGTADYDTEILLYQGSDCESAQLLACNDDAPNCSGYTSELIASVTAGESYYIRLGGWRDGSLGTGQMLVELQPSMHSADACADAVPIGDGLHDFTTIGATTDGPVHLECELFDKGVTGNDIWFVYTAETSGTLEVSTCNLVDYDSDLVIYDGTDCENLVLLGCNDDTRGCAEYSSYVLVEVSAGDSYLIRVGGWEEGTVGSGQLSIMLNDG